MLCLEMPMDPKKNETKVDQKFCMLDNDFHQEMQIETGL